MQYEHAVEAEQIARKLIRETHRHLKKLTIEYVFKEKMSGKGCRMLGHVRVLSGLNAYLSKHDLTQFYVMELNQTEWPNLSPAQREAVVDHELCHLAGPDNGKLSITPHDLEEFGDVIRRHGLYLPDRMWFAKAIFEQQEMEFPGTLSPAPDVDEDKPKPARSKPAPRQRKRARASATSSVRTW